MRLATEGSSRDVYRRSAIATSKRIGKQHVLPCKDDGRLKSKEATTSQVPAIIPIRAGVVNANAAYTLFAVLLMSWRRVMERLATWVTDLFLSGQQSSRVSQIEE